MIPFLLMGCVRDCGSNVSDTRHLVIDVHPPRIETCEALPFSSGGRASCCKAALSSMLLRPFCLE